MIWTPSSVNMPRMAWRVVFGLAEVIETFVPMT
jgi:hypothetical protein